MFAKKGQVLIYGLIAGLIAAIIFSYVGNVQTKRDFGVIGESSVRLLETSEEAEKAMFYADQSAKYSAYQAIYDLAKYGGCKTDDNPASYSVWGFGGNAECSPGADTAQKAFIDQFLKKLDGFLSDYKYAAFQPGNYNIVFKDNDVIGAAKEPLKFLFIKEGRIENVFSGYYSIKPSFRVSLDYDFSDYSKLMEKSQELIGICSGRNPESCLDANKDIFDDESFELLESCEPEQKENFFKVVDYAESCSYSDDNSCICTQNNPSVKGSYDISQDGNDILIADKNNKELRERIKNANMVDSYVYIGGASYVHKDDQGKVIISGYWDGKTCTPKPQTKFRFCVQSRSSSIYAYDETDKTAKPRPVIYKFALDFDTGNDILKGSSGNDILTESSDIRERIRLVSQEIGFTNLELALKLAKTESNFRHCTDSTLNCGTSNNQNVLTNGKDFGVMQINIDAHPDLFTKGAQRLSLFACKEGETVYDLDCNIKSGLKILQQNYNAYGFNAERYNNAVDEVCKDDSNNAKYKSYTGWDRALRAYNGFGCNTQVAGYVEKVDSAIV